MVGGERRKNGIIARRLGRHLANHGRGGRGLGWTFPTLLAGRSCTWTACVLFFFFNNCRDCVCLQPKKRGWILPTFCDRVYCEHFLWCLSRFLLGGGFGKGGSRLKRHLIEPSMVWHLAPERGNVPPQSASHGRTVNGLPSSEFTPPSASPPPAARVAFPFSTYSENCLCISSVWSVTGERGREETRAAAAAGCRRSLPYPEANKTTLHFSLGGRPLGEREKRGEGRVSPKSRFPGLSGIGYRHVREGRAPFCVGKRSEVGFLWGLQSVLVLRVLWRLGVVEDVGSSSSAV